MEFGYWPIKGISEPLRWIFLHLGLDVTEWNPQSEEEWAEKAKTLGPFASLPYLKDGDLIITETTMFPSAIPNYLIEKSGNAWLLGKDNATRAQVRQLDSLLANIRLQLINLIGQAQGTVDHKEVLGTIFAKDGKIYQQLVTISALLGEKDYLFGELTLADLMLVFTARFTGAACYSLLGYSPYADFENIVRLMFRVSELPGIKARLDGAQAAPYLPASQVPFKFLNFGELIDLGMKPI